MRNLIIITSLILNAVSLFAKTNDAELYRLAYEFIKKDSIFNRKEITISYNIIDMIDAWTTDWQSLYLEKFDLLRKERIMKHYNYSPSVYSKELDELGKQLNVDKPDMIIFFSTISCGCLRADVFPVSDINIQDERSYYFSSAVAYLFIFKDNKSIMDVKRQNMVYG